MKLSAIIIAKNAAKTIERTIRSLSFVDEVVVIDAESSDATCRQAVAAGARCITHPWIGYGPQKNYGALQAKGEWLLFIDADEVVTPKLRQQIIGAVNMPQTDFYWLRIVTVFLGRPLVHLFGHNPRLFKKTSGSWTSDLVHEQVRTITGQQIRLNDQQSTVLRSPLLHYSHPTISSYLNRMHRYATLDAEQMAKTGQHRLGYHVHADILLPLRLSVRQFVKLLLYRRGILDGYAGFMWCLLSAYYEWTMARQFLRLS